MTHTISLKSGLSFDIKTAGVAESMLFFDMVMAMDPFRWGNVVIVPKWIASMRPGFLGGLPSEIEPIPVLLPAGSSGFVMIQSLRRRPVPAFSEN